MSNPTPRLYGVERQFQIYLSGMAGQRPALPLSYEELERRASEKLTPEAYGYVAGGAGGEQTMRANRAAFERWQIVPRMLRNVADRDPRVELFGATLPAPMLYAPIGVQSIVHPEAEVAVARAAASLDLPLILSTASSRSMEEVAQAMGNTPRWFQLYWSKDNDLTASFLSRAECAGYSAVVVTLDTNLLSWRERDLQNAYLPFLLGEGIANYLTDPVFRAALAQSPEDDPQAAIMHWARIFANPALTWGDLRFLREHTRLPILLKGILHPHDAALAMEMGVDGVIVPNHGGRQVDGAVAALEALPAVAQVVDGRVPLLFDSGIRRGADAFKALALGARAVLLGRPYIWGLALGGEEGVRDVTLNFLGDLDLTLALSGYSSFAQVTPDALVRE
ncbi:MAG TPA: alpha-hydroxy-acid oxidizing protein [Ktedonobacterales bacterium]|nr:alpha-hydroxy-acid oxidizing protein [Ktedonobacterales bacterium]